ncbi:MAG: hypothetical protein R3C68_00180 [Myxococcota bacterium]
MSVTPAPSRVVSQTVFSDEILWRLGTQAHTPVVGVSKFADDVRYSDVAGLWPKTVIRLSSHSEDIFRLQPDLVIVAPFSSPEVHALMTATGIKTLRLEPFSGIDSLRRNVLAIATALGLTGQGNSANQRF